MNFKARIWYPISVVLSVVNVGAVWFAAQPGEPWHATVHAALAVGFGLWAQRLRQGRRVREDTGGTELRAGLEGLEGEMSALRQELGEMQERMDFAERMLAREPEARRVDPQR
jgi:hypothetical protein